MMKPLPGNGLVLSFRNEIIGIGGVLAVFAHIALIASPFAAWYVGILFVVVIVRFLIRASRGTLANPYRTFWSWVRDNLVVLIFVLVGEWLAVALLGPAVARQTRPEYALPVYLLLYSFVLRALVERAHAGCSLALFRSFDPGVSYFTSTECAPTLAGYGRLAIVNDEVSAELLQPPLFGLGVLGSVPVEEQRFFRNEVWMQGVASIIASAHVFVIDVSRVTQGLWWEIEHVRATRSGAPVLYIANAAMASPSNMSVNVAMMGSFENPIRYSSGPIGTIKFRFDVHRFMRRISESGQ